MKTLLAISSLLFIATGFSPTLIPEALKLQTAFANLSADPDNKRLQENYIAAFPTDTKTFLIVFQQEKFDQLYSESNKYINELERCSTSFPEKAMSKCINIGKNLIWDADAVGELQQISVTLNARYISVFISLYKNLKNKEQENLIQFYANVENHGTYKIYQDLIDKLNSVGQRDISEKLETARTSRKLQKDH